MARGGSGGHDEELSGAFSAEAILFGVLAPRTPARAAPDEAGANLDVFTRAYRMRLEEFKSLTLSSSPESLEFLADLFHHAAFLDRHPKGDELKRRLLTERLDPVEARATAQRIFGDYQPQLVSGIAVSTMQFIGSVEDVADMCREGNLPGTRADVRAAAENMCLQFKGRTGAPKVRDAVISYMETAAE